MSNLASAAAGSAYSHERAAASGLVDLLTQAHRVPLAALLSLAVHQGAVIIGFPSKRHCHVALAGNVLLAVLRGTVRFDLIADESLVDPSAAAAQANRLERARDL